MPHFLSSGLASPPSAPYLPLRPLTPSLGASILLPKCKVRRLILEGSPYSGH